ncbi:hypothetical protein J2S49_001589 [Arcanobacterium wilhelmae]|uniref:DUF2800 domain-containing protein n=1 Tax=Arcanobacterium wilhelmae TaxID=1803177 RepID=A0ABT9NDB2_9ACTO|nr:DUF2800 domain-containing protein [Arcanobacterium wilhelmae]MDP9801513.1 hypothetical protein [Arcanobacterium wilhelmae]
MPPNDHALLSASSAHRWLECPPSVLASLEVADTSSAAAEQGTAAHELAEFKLRRALHLNPTVRPVSDWHDAEMETHTDDYVAYIQQVLSSVRESTPDPLVCVEQRLDFSHVVPDGFGTGDCVIVADGIIHVIDLKYGAGVLVEAEENPQLKLYALGALHAFEALYEVGEVVVHIFQPRRDNVTSWATTATELTTWAETEVAPKAELAVAGEGEFCPGAWCQFCKIAPTCRARAQANLDLARFEFAPPAELTDSEIAEVLAQLPQLTKWASDVEAYATSLAVNQGKTWDGFKLVAGRSIRKYTNESKVVEALEAAGCTDVYDQKLRTITTLEKQLGKKRFAEILAGLVVKPAGKPCLVPITDKRPALDVRDAGSEFTLTDN